MKKRTLHIATFVLIVSASVTFWFGITGALSRHNNELIDSTCIKSHNAILMQRMVDSLNEDSIEKANEITRMDNQRFFELQNKHKKHSMTPTNN